MREKRTQAAGPAPVLLPEKLDQVPGLAVVNIGNSQVGYNAAWLLSQADAKINIFCRYDPPQSRRLPENRRGEGTCCQRPAKALRGARDFASGASPSSVGPKCPEEGPGRGLQQCGRFGRVATPRHPCESTPLAVRDRNQQMPGFHPGPLGHPDSLTRRRANSDNRAPLPLAWQPLWPNGRWNHCQRQ